MHPAMLLLLLLLLLPRTGECQGGHLAAAAVAAHRQAPEVCQPVEWASGVVILISNPLQARQAEQAGTTQ